MYDRQDIFLNSIAPYKALCIIKALITKLQEISIKGCTIFQKSIFFFLKLYIYKLIIHRYIWCKNTSVQFGAYFSQLLYSPSSHFRIKKIPKSSKFSNAIKKNTFLITSPSTKSKSLWNILVQKDGYNLLRDKFF